MFATLPSERQRHWNLTLSLTVRPNRVFFEFCINGVDDDCPVDGINGASVD